MKVSIQRFNDQHEPNNKLQEFHIDENSPNLLKALETIKTQKDNSLSFRCGCKSGVCGSCAVRVNGVERLACKTILKENDIIEPLKNSETIRDLVINLNHEEKFLAKTKAYIHEFKETPISQEDEKHIDRQSNCILCQSCFSSCPVYEVNPNFLGPYALTRALRYVQDKKQNNTYTIIHAIQNNGVWDCTLCGNCTMVCPQFIDPKTDIMNLRMKSVQEGFEDPTMQSFANVSNEFDMGFDPSGGFDPNSGFNPNGF
jgi:fumarate reductase iron-sulfur subunit